MAEDEVELSLGHCQDLGAGAHDSDGSRLLMEQAAKRNVDFDAECVRYGQLENILWLAPTGLAWLSAQLRVTPSSYLAACCRAVAMNAA